jgi:hypothetical protein
VLKPFTESRVLAQDIKDLDNCSIPISLGVRREDMKGAGGTKRVIYDVVINPLVYQRCRSDIQFRAFTSMLAIEKVVKQESMHAAQAKLGNIRVRKGVLSFPPISYKAGKEPQKHVLQLEADPAFFKVVEAPALAQAEPNVMISPALTQENHKDDQMLLNAGIKLRRESLKKTGLIEVVHEKGLSHLAIFGPPPESKDMS